MPVRGFNTKSEPIDEVEFSNATLENPHNEITHYIIKEIYANPIKEIPQREVEFAVEHIKQINDSTNREYTADPAEVRYDMERTVYTHFVGLTPTTANKIVGEIPSETQYTPMIAVDSLFKGLPKTDSTDTFLHPQTTELFVNENITPILNIEAGVDVTENTSLNDFNKLFEQSYIYLASGYVVDVENTATMHTNSMNE